MIQIYWDIKTPLSYNTLFNFIIGNRGCGKSYGCKKWAIEDFLRNGNQFVYVRRYKQEFKKIKTFFNDISQEYPDTQFKVEGYSFFINGELAGYGLPLSTAKIEKSNSYPNVNKIIFDEFIIDKGVYRYLSDEVTCFLELYETVARMREVKAFFISNAITFTNPYFIYFKIEKPRNKKLIAAANDILIQLVEDSEFIDAKKKTRFAKIIEGTSYADYSIENKFLRDNENFIVETPKNMRYFFTLKFVNQVFGVWRLDEQGAYYVSEKYDPSSKLIYTTMLDVHQPNTMLLKGADKSILFTSFVKAYKMGRVYFDKVGTKNVVLETIKHTL